jgi:uncharacterized protein (TIGR00251 family)
MGRLAVRVVPRASREEVVGFDEAGRLRVRLTAPPVEGEANRALLRFVARKLGVPRTRVTLVKGASSRTKWIEVEGLEEEELRRRLAE